MAAIPRVSINQKQVNLEFQKQFWSKPAGQNLAKGQAQVRVNNAHKKLKALYETHPVTLELRAGADSDKPSTYINYGGSRGQGNLFTFLGFYAGSDPLSSLDNMMYRKIIVPSSSPKKLAYNFTIRIPTIEEAEDRTQNLPWTDASWVQLIEGGLPNNIMHYVVFPEGSNSSRSTKALQIEGMDLSSDFGPVSYISELVNKFNEELSKQFGSSNLVKGNIS